LTLVIREQCTRNNYIFIFCGLVSIIEDLKMLFLWYMSHFEQKGLDIFQKKRRMDL